MSLLLGCIADDFTGATDLASFLVNSGMRTLQLIGVPEHTVELAEYDAVVIALKTRTLPAEQAVKESLEALEWLIAQECSQYYFKYCSTFDSTKQGNIGPVTDALMARLEVKTTILCPALPVNGRTVYQGHLFVHEQLLSDSGMRDHPLTPMTDANLLRLMKQQAEGEVGLINLHTVRQGADKVSNAINDLAGQYRYLVMDAITHEDLDIIGQASNSLKLITGGSGLAPGLASSFKQHGLLASHKNSTQLDSLAGCAVVLSGSCSLMTQQQVAHFRPLFPSFKIDPMAIAQETQTVEGCLQWFEEHKHGPAVMFYATDSADKIKQVQQKLGVDTAGELVERFMATLVDELNRRKVNKLIVAGGETSGAVIKALNPTQLKVGQTIAPGVPLAQVLGEEPKLVTLKSGNFGQADFFSKALKAMS
ncbi:3-oxo-tetronate kinase [Marinomonas epiphytica]